MSGNSPLLTRITFDEGWGTKKLRNMPALWEATLDPVPGSR